MATGISISAGGSTTLLIILIAVFILGIAFFYKRTVPPLKPSQKILLSVIRSLAAALLLLVLFESVIRSTNIETQPPEIAVLIDNSESMNISDKTGPRRDLIDKWLRQDNLGPLKQDLSVTYYFFSSNLTRLADNMGDSLRFSGERTNISEVLDGLGKLSAAQNIQAVIILSDGNYNAGKNPVYSAEKTKIPIYTIGVGDTDVQKDIVIRRVITSQTVYANTKVPVDVSVRSTGFDSANVELMLLDGKTIVDKKVLMLTKRREDYRERLFVEPEAEGAKKYQLTISSLPGELTERNNSANFYVNVLKSKLRIMIIAGAPDPDVSAVRQVLEEDEHFFVQAFIQKDQAGFYSGTISQSTIDSSDCILTIGFPTQATSDRTLQLLAEGCEKGKKSLFFVGGKRTDYNKLRQIESLLPFRWTNINSEELLVYASVPDRFMNHPLISRGSEMTAQGWQQLPPAYRTKTLFQEKAGSEGLVAMKTKNREPDEPLIVSRTVNRQKSLAITGYGIWRWRLLAQNNAYTEKTFSAFFASAVRWLSTRDDDKKVRVSPVKEIFTSEEPPEFIGQVFDEQMKPLDDAQVIMEVSLGPMKLQSEMKNAGQGRYDLSMEGLAEGDYSYNCRAVKDGRLIGEDKGKFTVGRTNVEFIDTKMNKALLEQIAYSTGGKYYDIDKSADIASVIKSDLVFEPEETPISAEIELWNWRYLAGIIILLFSLEWFLRKRNGML